MWPWRVKMPTPNSRLLLLLVLVMRIVLATVCCRFGSWCLVIKLNFCSDFEHFGQDFWSWKFRRDFEAEIWSAFWRWCFEEVTKLNLGQYSEARQKWNLSKNLLHQIFRLKILHRQFHLIWTVLVRKNTKNEWKMEKFTPLANILHFRRHWRHLSLIHISEPTRPY